MKNEIVIHGWHIGIVILIIYITTGIVTFFHMKSKMGFTLQKKMPLLLCIFLWWYVLAIDSTKENQ